MTENLKPLVLVVDDEPQIRRLLNVTLEANGYRVLPAATAQEGLVLAAQHRPDLVILDIGLPDLSGHETLRRLREWSHVPVLILSVHGSEKDKVAALDAGADDYVTKPFNTEELLARLRTASRHAVQAKSEEPVFHCDDLVVDLVGRRVTRKGQPIKLTTTEYALLRLFIQHAGKVLTHRYILQSVWGANQEERTHYLRVYMTRLRDKLEMDPAKPKLFVTESGVGYRLHI